MCDCLDCRAERIKSKSKLEDYRVHEVFTEKTVMVPKTVKETKFYFKGKEINPIGVSDSFRDRVEVNKWRGDEI